MDDYGFVYFLSNSSMPGMYKIGFTTKHPRLRMAELASSSGCPTPFTLLAYFGAPTPQRIESALHRTFADRRINGRREFFHLEVGDLARVIEHYWDRFDDVCYRSGLDDLMFDHAFDAVETPVVQEKTEEEKAESRRVARAAINAALMHARAAR